MKVGDIVYIKDEMVFGKVEELTANGACVSYATAGGGACLPFDYSELGDVWIIGEISYLTHYLVHGNTFFKEGYYWTTGLNELKENFNNNSPEHPFLFPSEEEALAFYRKHKNEPNFKATNIFFEVL